ncbi:MAG: hypothetical protein M4579_001948 [Chaenotheca gracillima]|nr:MAG: hypothetical protein M4579_001948 [Chaenotheca gracillima]
MAPINDAHHHRSTTSASNKSFKSRHASKGALKEISKGKVSKENQKERGHRRTPHQQVMSKIDRRNQARQRQQTKHNDHVKATSIFSGRNAAPRVVAVIPLCDDLDSEAAILKLAECLDLDIQVNGLGRSRLAVDRFKQRVDFISVGRDLLQALEVARAADFVVFVISAQSEVSELGEAIIRGVEGQGVTNVLTLAEGLDNVEPPKRRPNVIDSLRRFMTHFFPDQTKIHALFSRQECLNVMRSICTTTPRGIRWREERSWMLVEEAQWSGDNDQSTYGEVVLTGVVRGKGLKADRLVQVGDWGDFQIDKITSAHVEAPKRPHVDGMAVDEDGPAEVLERPTEDQDDLQDLAREELPMMDADEISMAPSTIEKKGVLLDDHHYFSDDMSHIPPVPKRLPKGTSTYQSAWYLDDVSDSGSDLEDMVDDEPQDALKPLPADGMEGLLGPDQREPTEIAPSEAPQSEMFLDRDAEEEAEQLAAFRSKRKDEAEEDAEFPDEIELHPNVLARERLARYRGLKSLRSSHWETSEDAPHEPEEWNRLLQVPDYRGSKSQVLRESLVGGVAPGTRVHVHLRNVPLTFKSAQPLDRPIALYSLLRHEHKRAVVNYSITLDSEYPVPLKSKEPLILQCGPRRFLIEPIFSQMGNTPNNVHKFDRFLHPGRTAIATFIAPMTWGSVPALFFKPTPPKIEEATSEMLQTPPVPLSIIAKGTSEGPDRDRVIAKRLILTGHPYKINKKLVTIRYMFFNAEDVNWFKALQLWTRRGRSGFIKESLGTHGYFKATFDGKINPQDAVGVSLYKRVFPRSAERWNKAML